MRLLGPVAKVRNIKPGDWVRHQGQLKHVVIVNYYLGELVFSDNLEQRFRISEVEISE